MTINIRFTELDWERIACDWNAWWAGELERPLVVLETVDPVEADWSQLTKYGLDTPVDEILDNWERILESAYWLGDAFPKWWVNFGPGTMAAFLGSRVSWTPDTTWFWPLEGIDRLEEPRRAARGFARDRSLDRPGRRPLEGGPGHGALDVVPDRRRGGHGMVSDDRSAREAGEEDGESREGWRTTIAFDPHGRLLSGEPPGQATVSSSASRLGRRGRRVLAESSGTLEIERG